jgi:hypothetical protein
LAAKDYKTEGLCCVRMVRDRLGKYQGLQSASTNKGHPAGKGMP